MHVNIFFLASIRFRPKKGRPELAEPTHRRWTRPENRRNKLTPSTTADDEEGRTITIILRHSAEYIRKGSVNHRVICRDRDRILAI